MPDENDITIKLARALGAAEAALDTIILMALHTPNPAQMVVRVVERARADIDQIMERETI